MILRMPCRLAILLSISWISLLAMFFRTPSRSNSCSIAALSFFSCASFVEPPAAPGVDGPSSSIFRPRDTRRRNFLPSSVSSGKLAWKPWKSE